MAELDQLLRDSFARVAEQTTTPARDSADIADSIRQRVASGDAGAPAPSSTAPGWGGVGVGGVLGAIGVVAVAGIAGAALGLSGWVGHPTTERQEAWGAALVVRADAYRCVEGAVVGSVPADTRVLAVARDDDGSWVGVRNPATLVGTIWFPADVIVADDGADWDALPIGGACPAFATEPLTPEAAPIVDPPPDPPPGPQPGPAPGPQPAPQPGPGPAPAPGDTTAPVITQWWASPTHIYQNEATTVFALATDDVDVAGVQLSWSGAKSGSGSMTKVGSEWRFTLTNSPAVVGNVTFTMRAVDAAGNLSAPRMQSVTLDVFG